MPLQLDRKQAVYAGYAGTDPEGRSILCSCRSAVPPATATRDPFEAQRRTVEGHFAIRQLRGEEYFVVIENLPAESVERLDAGGLVRESPA